MEVKGHLGGGSASGSDPHPNSNMSDLFTSAKEKWCLQLRSGCMVDVIGVESAVECWEVEIRVGSGAG